MTVKSIWLRRIHKWVGLIIGLQVVIWALSGAMMALLDMEEVAGGAKSELVPAPRPAKGAWQAVRASLASERVTSLQLRELPVGLAYQVTTPRGVRLFDVRDGRPMRVNGATAAEVARAAYGGAGTVKSVARLGALTLAVRGHELPIWKIDFDDEANSSFYVSATTGELLERRNDTWRTWDFFWMLHTMDYAKRTSFNHPLIITVGLAMAWLAITGFWLLFRTMWRHDLAALKRGFAKPARGSDAKAD